MLASAFPAPDGARVEIRSPVLLDQLDGCQLAPDKRVPLETLFGQVVASSSREDLSLAASAVRPSGWGIPRTAFRVEERLQRVKG